MLSILFYGLLHFIAGEFKFGSWTSCCAFIYWFKIQPKSALSWAIWFGVCGSKLGSFNFWLSLRVSVMTAIMWWWMDGTDCFMLTLARSWLCWSSIDLPYILPPNWFMREELGDFRYSNVFKFSVIFLAEDLGDWSWLCSKLMFEYSLNSCRPASERMFMALLRDGKAYSVTNRPGLYLFSIDSPSTWFLEAVTSWRRFAFYCTRTSNIPDFLFLMGSGCCYDWARWWPRFLLILGNRRMLRSAISDFFATKSSSFGVA